jgi:hypothetical protein
MLTSNTKKNNYSSSEKKVKLKKSETIKNLSNFRKEKDPNTLNNDIIDNLELNNSNFSFNNQIKKFYYTKLIKKENQPSENYRIHENDVNMNINIKLKNKLSKKSTDIFFNTTGFSSSPDLGATKNTLNTNITEKSKNIQNLTVDKIFNSTRNSRKLQILEKFLKIIQINLENVKPTELNESRKTESITCLNEIMSVENLDPGSVTDSVFSNYTQSNRTTLIPDVRKSSLLKFKTNSIESLMSKCLLNGNEIKQINDNECEDYTVKLEERNNSSILDIPLNLRNLESKKNENQLEFHRPKANGMILTKSTKKFKAHNITFKECQDSQDETIIFEFN